MKKIIIIIIFIIISIKSEIDTSKMLIIFFTRTGNTELLTDYIKECLNIESYKIIPVKEYPSDTNEMTQTARKERDTYDRPKIIQPLTDISKYNKILLGYPIWFSYLPCIVITQLLKLNFEGKTIYPFNTHETSGIGSSNQELKLYTPGAIIKKGFAIKGSVIRNNKEDSMKEIKKWLKYHFGYEYDYKEIIKFKLIYLICFVFII